MYTVVLTLGLCPLLGSGFQNQLCIGLLCGLEQAFSPLPLAPTFLFYKTWVVGAKWKYFYSGKQSLKYRHCSINGMIINIWLILITHTTPPPRCWGFPGGLISRTIITARVEKKTTVETNYAHARWGKGSCATGSQTLMHLFSSNTFRRVVGAGEQAQRI